MPRPQTPLSERKRQALRTIEEVGLPPGETFEPTDLFPIFQCTDNESSGRNQTYLLLRYAGLPYLRSRERGRGGGYRIPFRPFADWIGLPDDTGVDGMDRFQLERAIHQGEWIPLPAVATILNWSVDRARDWLKRHQVRSCRRRGRLFFNTAEVYHTLEQGDEEPGHITDGFLGYEEDA